MIAAKFAMPVPNPDPDVRDAVSFQSCWLAETIRLREARWGPLDDAVECRQARASGGSLPQRIVQRARLLARREGLDEAVCRWRRLARVALAGLSVLGLLAGASAALAALGDGTRLVNLALALLILLGLHLATFFLWLISLLRRGSGESAWLGKAWLWLSNRLARGPDQTLPPAALAEWLGRHNLLRWVFGSISHLTWTLALLGQIGILLLMLAARQYAFAWQTTLLPPGFFVALTQGLGWLPAQLGFILPATDTVHASLNQPAADAGAHAQWSSWLIGCVVVYGLLPRLASLAWCLLALGWRVRRLTVDVGLPGYADLRTRLMPATVPIEPDAPPGIPTTAITPRAAPLTARTASAIAIAVELPEDISWPPPGLTDVAVGPNITQRTEREAVLQQFYRDPPRVLVVAVDGDQTPDRGTLAFLQELQPLAGQLHVVVLAAGTSASRAPLWRDAVAHLPAPTPTLHDAWDMALAVLRVPDPMHATKP